MSLPRERLVPLIVACGLFMENLDSTVLATALPAIATSLDVNPLRLNLAHHRVSLQSRRLHPGQRLGGRQVRRP